MSDDAALPVSVETRLGRGIRLFALLIAGVLVVMLAAWIIGPEARENLSTDWTAFDRAADRVWAGEPVYRPYDSETERLPYLYPPYALWLSLPLAAGGFYVSFLLSAALTLTALVAAVRLVLRLAPAELADRRAAAVLPLCSGAAISSTLIGQYSGLLALSVAAGLYLYTRGRFTPAGVVLALLCLKPNLAIAVPVVLVWSRSWQTLRGFAAGAGGLLVLSLPFGLDAWRGFFDNVRMMTELQRDDVVPFDKMITVQASVRQVLGLSGDSPLLWVLYGLVVLILGLAILQVWTPRALAASPARAFGMLALFVVAANARLYFYDSTLVALGALALYVARPALTSPRLSRVQMALLLATWPTLWGGLFLSVNVLVGPVAAALIVVTGLDVRLAPAGGERPNREGPEGLFGDVDPAPKPPLKERARVGSAKKEKT